MRKYAFTVLIVFFALLFIHGSRNDSSPVTENTTPVDTIQQLYSVIFANRTISEEAFRLSLSRMKELKSEQLLSNDSILTIIDFSKSCNEERFFIVDLKNKHVIKRSLVAHGKNSGIMHATEFSNTPRSLMSSLGVYLTGQTYIGKHGYSLKLLGMDEGMNDNAYKRAVVIHGAGYVSDSYIQKNGRIGRSFGCPALPIFENRPIIDLIKNNTCLFIYHPTLKDTIPDLAHHVTP